MFVLTSPMGPVAALNDGDKARAWADKFGWSVSEVPNGDEKEPVIMKTGFMNILSPTQLPSYRQPIISFSAQSNFPDANSLCEGDVFFKSNLENFAFNLPEDVDPNEKALEFWRKLHARGLDLQRQINDQFKVVKIEGKEQISSESPSGHESVRTNPVPTGNPKLKVGALSGGSTGVDPSKPLPPGVIVESINGNPAIGGSGS